MSIDLSDAELVVMNALWRKSPLRAGQVFDAVAPKRQWHKKTVNTLVRRLVNKGAVGYDESPGGFLYFPLLEKSLFRNRKAQELISNLFDGQLSPFLTSFIEPNVLSDRELEELQRLVSKLSER